MRKKTTLRAPLPVIGPVDDPYSLYHQMRQFLEWLLERNYSDMGIRNRETNLRAFVAWCDERGVTRPQEVTRQVIERYQRYLFLYGWRWATSFTTHGDGAVLSGVSSERRSRSRWIVAGHRHFQ
jgi:site-specific recombinase XerD